VIANLNADLIMCLVKSLQTDSLADPQIYKLFLHACLILVVYLV
jgi:hypothetical protein